MHSFTRLSTYVKALKEIERTLTLLQILFLVTTKRTERNIGNHFIFLGLS